MEQNGAAPTTSTTHAGGVGDCSFVSLAEALTYIAFGAPMSVEELRASVEGDWTPEPVSIEERIGEFISTRDELIPDIPGFTPSPPGTDRFRDRQAGLERLDNAWRDLRNDVERGVIKMRGRYTAIYSLADAHLADRVELTRDKLATFSQFDVSTGGIRRQPQDSPSILWRDHPQSFDRAFDSLSGDQRSADGYLLVEVERADLGKVPIAEAARAPAVKQGRPPSDEVILAKADEMRARGLDGYAIAKTLRFEPGFENVATTAVRALIKGRWKPAGRPKKPS